MSATPRTWSPGGVTGTAVPSASSAGAATSSRLVPSESAVHTIRPSPVQPGTPATTSSQRASVSSRSTATVPRAGPADSSRIPR